MSFTTLGLSPELLRAVADEGYTTPTPVQREAIPLVLAGRDLLAGAQTGTGKTAAFVLPILQRLAERPLAGRPQQPTSAARPGRPGMRPAGGPVRVLVLTPTRELALQVEAAVRTYGRHRPAKSVAIYGGVGFEPQVRALRAGPPIVVATPGRLLDHAGRGTVDLGSVEVLVLDEADRMLDMGFIRDIRRILELLPAARQNLLFSATFSDEIRTLAGGLLDRPATVDVAPRNTAAELVDQLVIPVDRHRKAELLAHLIRSGRVAQALVFVRTKHGANRLADGLVREGISAAAIHGNKSQGQRVRALTDFTTGRVDILVATDIAARGIDIDSLPHVVNVELPMVAADYVHRIGRTGRAGAEGRAISLVCVDEAGLLRDIEKLLGRSIPAEVIDGFEPDRSARPEPIRLRSGQGGGGRVPQAGRSPQPGRASQGRTAQGRPAHGRPPQARPTHPGRPGPLPARPARGVQPARPGQPGRSQPARGPQPTRGTQAVRGAQPFRQAQPGRPAQPSRPAPGRGERPGHAFGHGTGQNRGGAGSGRPGWNDRSTSHRPLVALPGERLSRVTTGGSPEGWPREQRKD